MVSQAESGLASYESELPALTGYLVDDQLVLDNSKIKVYDLPSHETFRQLSTSFLSTNLKWFVISVLGNLETW